MSWFYQLFGFEENEFNETKTRFKLSKNKRHLMSRVNNREYTCGTFSTPSLKELKEQANDIDMIIGKPRVKHIVTDDIMLEHEKSENRRAMFQVASQFNCLEFSGPGYTPEMGITGYIHDATQGPACSLAAPAATVYRNYFTNQTKEYQIDNSEDLHEYLKSIDDTITSDYWSVKNGYTNSTKDQLKNLKHILRKTSIIQNKKRGTFSEPEREKALSNLRVGLHSGVEVRLPGRTTNKTNKVSQVFCSAVSCAYGNNMITKKEWEPLARLILDGAYEATLWAAAIEYSMGIGSGKVFLTMLGGGAFGNEPHWIEDAISRAILKITNARLSLDINIVHFKSIDERAKIRVNNNS